MARKLTKEFLISEFWRYYDEFNIYPQRKDLNNTKGYPSATGYVRIWHTWENFLKDIGIVDKDNTDGWYIVDENVLREKYFEGKKQDIIDSLMIKRAWGTIKVKASKLGLSRNLSLSKRQLSDEYLIRKLKELADRLGKTPTDHDIREATDFPSTKVYQKRFGSWNNALRLAELELNTEFNITKEDMIHRAREYFELNGRSPYWNELGFSRTVYERYWRTFPEMLLDAGLPLNRKTRVDHFKTDDELIEDYLNLYKELGRVPVANDINIHEDMASFSTYKLRFGGYKEIWEKCNVSNEIILDENKYGFICLDKNGEVCKSYAEMVITNLLIDNNIKYIKEYPYKKLIKNFNGRSYVMDWYFPNENICVEYFGIYREKHLNQEGDIGDYTRKAEKKKKILKENNYILIDIYQNDLNQTYLQRLTEKFKSFGIDLKVKQKNLYKNTPDKELAF